MQKNSSQHGKSKNPIQPHIYKPKPLQIHTSTNIKNHNNKIKIQHPPHELKHQQILTYTDMSKE